MLRKNYFTFLIVVALFLAGSLTIFAQTAPVRGKIELVKADGTTVPAANAVVEVYRTDAKGKLPKGKTNKKGEFAFAGFPLGQVFMLSVSAPNVQAQVFPNVRAGQEGITLTVYEGDGKVLTEEEARAALVKKPKTGAPAQATEQATAQNVSQPETAQPAEPRKLTEEEKKAQAEYEKQVAEVTAKNKKAENANAIVNKTLKEGVEALNAKNYDVAVSKFDEGIAADPDYAGSAPVLLNNKAEALRLRGFTNYKQALTDTANKASLLDKAKKDFQGAAQSSQRALEILKTATSTDAKVQKNYEAGRLIALSNLVEVHRLMIASGLDRTQNKEAVAFLDQYAAVETNADQKAKMGVLLADALRTSGDSTNAVPIYRKVLETSPSNPDALGGMGLSLFDVGVSNTDRAQMQEGLNMMEQFTQVAPDTHPLKTDIRGAVEYLKTNEKLLPQKVTRPAPRKKG